MAGLTQDEIFAGVRDCLVESLDLIDPDLVQPGAALIDGLGADSLDLLDVLFHLERRFGCRLKPGEIQRQIEERLAGSPVEVDGVFTDAALAELRHLMPEVPATELAPGLGPGGLPRRFRVATLMRLVERTLNGMEASDG